MQKSDQIGSLVTAMAKAQAEITNPPLDSVNPHFKNRYASLAVHLESIRAPFARHGLVMLQGVANGNGMVVVTTMIAHSSGEWISSAMEMPMPDRATAQQIGSIVTYLRRYSLASMALITGDEEDDAETDRVARQKPSGAIPVARTPESVAPAAIVTKTDHSVFDNKAVKQKKWDDTGTDIVLMHKAVERPNGVKGVLCEHPTLGSQWVSFDEALSDSVVIGGRITLTWRWSISGKYFEAVHVAPVPKMSDFKEIF